MINGLFPKKKKKKNTSEKQYLIKEVVDVDLFSFTLFDAIYTVVLVLAAVVFQLHTVCKYWHELD